MLYHNRKSRQGTKEVVESGHIVGVDPDLRQAVVMIFVVCRSVRHDLPIAIPVDAVERIRRHPAFELRVLLQLVWSDR